MVQAYVALDRAYREEMSQVSHSEEAVVYTAVCQACEWDGPEDDVEYLGSGVDGPGDVCPACGQEQILYFTPSDPGVAC